MIQEHTISMGHGGVPALVVHPHPLVGDGRITETALFQPNETLGAYVERVGVRIPSGALSVWHNGFSVPEALWRRLIPRTGDQVVIRARMEGGGSGSKVLRSVAMVALVLVSAGYGAALGGALSSSLGMGLTAAQAASFGSALIMIGGGALVTPLLPEIKA